MIGVQMMQAVGGEIDRLADAHAGQARNSRAAESQILLRRSSSPCSCASCSGVKGRAKPDRAGYVLT